MDVAAATDNGIEATGTNRAAYFDGDVEIINGTCIGCTDRSDVRVNLRLGQGFSPYNVQILLPSLRMTLITSNLTEHERLFVSQHLADCQARGVPCGQNAGYH